MDKAKHFMAVVALSIGLGFPVNMAAGDINIIPTPKEMTEGTGVFKIGTNTLLASNGKEAEKVAKLFAAKLKQASKLILKKGKVGKNGTITFAIDKNIKGKEAYVLDVTPEKVVAKASTETGLYYALQSLLQLLPSEIEESYSASRNVAWEVPAVQINDAPRFPYRGVMLDPCRHFLPASEVKAEIERLSAYKINRIHWHLTEDQGWRIEIKKYPKLTTIGSQRVEGDGSIHRGYYTQDEVRDVVAFAKEHHVEIIPELEMPGHSMAAIAAYPWLSCKSEQMPPRIIWGVEDVVLCPGKETTFRFLEDVIDEMAPLFPGKLFHIGGDESPRGEWAKCDSCQARMKSLGYKKEAQLQSYLISRISKYLASKGKQLIGWDEILEGGDLDTTAIVMSWRGEDGGIAAAKMGHHVLMTPSGKGCYFDTYQSDPATEPVAIGGYTTLKKIYSYDPVPESLRKNNQENYVLGVQANCWSEYIYNAPNLEYRLFPRALALAEVAWSPVERKNYDDFVRRADNDASKRLKAWNINFHIPVPAQVGGSLNHLAFVDQKKISLTTPRPLRIVYTTDGTAPTVDSPTYTEPITLTQNTMLRVASVLPSGIMSPIRDIEVKKSEYLPAQKVGRTLISGLNLSVYKGTYQTPYTLPLNPDYTKAIADLRPIRTQTSVPGNVRNVENYAAVAEGFVKIDKKGVYEFSSNNNQVWIDGQLLVDNSLMACPRYSPNNAEIALSKGLHNIKVVFIGGIFAGWPTYWDDASVSIRPAGGSWKKIDGSMLFR